MKYYGVVYDVGLRFTPDALSVEPFDPDLVAHDMQVIANDLHANAVRMPLASRSSSTRGR